MDKVYMNLLRSRLEYFKKKPITELSDDEIQEYIALKKELLGELGELTESISRAFKNAFKPYANATERYSKAVNKQTD